MRLAAAGLVLLSLLTAGCASPARRQNMVAAPGPSAWVAGSPLADAIGLTVVEGGRSTIPVFDSEIDNAGFSEAMRNSLANARLLAPDGAGRFALSAIIERENRALRGLDMGVRLVVRYRLTRQGSQRTLWERTVTTEQTATFRDTPVASERRRIANERAVRENLGILVGELLRLGPADLS